MLQSRLKFFPLPPVSEESFVTFGDHIVKNGGVLGLIAFVLVSFLIWLYINAVQQMNMIHQQILQNGQDSLVVLKDIDTKLDSQTRLMYRSTPVSVK